MLPRLNSRQISLIAMAALMTLAIGCKSKQAENKCPPITVSLEPAQSGNDGNPIRDAEGRVQVEAGENSQWRVNVSGGTPPFKVSLEGFPDRSNVGSLVFNSRFNLPSSKEPMGSDNSALSASVVDAKGCASTQSNSLDVGINGSLRQATIRAAASRPAPVFLGSQLVPVVQEQRVPQTVVRQVTETVTTTEIPTHSTFY